MRWGLVKVNVVDGTAKVVKGKRFKSRKKALQYIETMHEVMVETLK